MEEIMVPLIRRRYVKGYIFSFRVGGVPVLSGVHLIVSSR